jgi:hypothetical protein
VIITSTPGHLAQLFPSATVRGRHDWCVFTDKQNCVLAECGSVAAHEILNNIIKRVSYAIVQRLLTVMGRVEGGEQFLTSPLAPRGNFAPWGKICPLGGMFTHSFTPGPRCERSLLYRRVEGQTENFTLKG